MLLVALVLSLIVLTLGAELLVRGATVISLRAGLSPLFVGLTIIGFGTSAPEMAASLVASHRGASDVAVGNVVGSNIFNIAGILGLVAVRMPIRIRFAAVRRDIVFALFASLVPYLTLLSQRQLHAPLGGVLLVLLGIVITVAYRIARRTSSDVQSGLANEVESTLAMGSGGLRWRHSLWFNLLLVGLGLTLLVFGSRGFVSSAIQLAAAFQIPDVVIGVTIVSVGTSLPELFTSLVAARHGSMDLAVGNVLGSNLFNLLGILGVSALVRSQEISPVFLRVDIPVMLLATFALLPIIKTGGVISRKEGALLLVGYGVYMFVQVRRLG